MFTRQRFAIPVLAFSSLLSLYSAHAEEKRISRSRLPVAVRRTADDQARGAIVRRYTTEIENGQREYEVELTINGRSRDVTIASDGRLLQIEEQVAAEALPQAVLYSLRNKAGQGEITRIESITKNGAVIAWEAHVRAAARRFAIRVDSNGQTLSRQE
jgi:hypothetical protein